MFYSTLQCKLEMASRGFAAAVSVGNSDLKYLCENRNELRLFLLKSGLFVDPNDAKVHTNSIESQWRVLKRSVLPKNGTSQKLYSSYLSMYCVKTRYLTDVPCEFKALLELVKRVYRLHPVENTPRKDLRNATSSNVSKVKVRTRSIGVGKEAPRKRGL